MWRWSFFAVGDQFIFRLASQKLPSGFAYPASVTSSLYRDRATCLHFRPSVGRRNDSKGRARTFNEQRANLSVLLTIATAARPVPTYSCRRFRIDRAGGFQLVHRIEKSTATDSG